MAGRKTASKSIKYNYKKISAISLTVLVFIGIFLYYIIVRVKDKQASKSSFFKSTFNFFGWSSSQDSYLSIDSVLSCIQEDLELIFTFIISWICLLVPRETTSIISAVVLLILTIITCVVTPKYRKKNQKKIKSDNAKETKKEVQNEHRDENKSKNLFSSFSSLILSPFYSLWALKSRNKPGNTCIQEHNGTCKSSKNGDLKCAICDDRRNKKYFFTRLTLYRLLTICVTCAFIVSIPWEYIRLFQIEVAKRMAVMEKGVPKECYPDKMTITESIRYWLLLQLSWQHDPCEKYHKAILVDPLWEITPLMVISSVITRSLLHPIEILFSGIGKSFRLFFHEIPVQWQPVMLVVMVILFTLTIIMFCGYRISLPMLLKIEPKTPVLGRIRSMIVRDSCVDNQQRQQDKEQKRLKFDTSGDL